MPEITPKKKRYTLVSVTATTIDFGLLLILTWTGLSTIKANYISTTVGFVYSFFANKKYTFKTADHHVHREAVEYVVFTLIGIWALQPIVIHIVEPILHGLGWHGWLVPACAKVAASLVTFFWNYFFYTRIVFRKKK